MYNLDWHNFETNCRNRNIEGDKAFQELAHNLFCRELNIENGLLERHNQKYLETEPYKPKEGMVIGYQAKYYDSPSVDSNKLKELLKEIKGAKDAYGITKIYLYLSGKLTCSSIKGKTETKAETDIREYASKEEITIIWRTDSELRDILYSPENADLLDRYFGQKSEIDMASALKKVKEKSRSVFETNPDYSEALNPARLKPETFEVVYEHLKYPDFPRVRHFDKNEKPNSTESAKTENIFQYFDNNLKESSLLRHIYVSGTSGSGKSTCLYGLWEKYLNTDGNVIPLYVPIYGVENSIVKYIEDTYLKYASEEFTFDYLKSHLTDTSFHLIILLDGYNELKGIEKAKNNKTSEIKGEIEDLFNIENITVVISSRNPEMTFNSSITRLVMCDLSPEQISSFLGGKKDFLPKDKYIGMITNPFMLQKCIQTFEGEQHNYENINQIPMEWILQEYLKKQMLKMRRKKRTYLNIILPLVSMKLDERKIDKEEIPGLEESQYSSPLCSDKNMADSKEIHPDPRSYKWSDFWDACEYVRQCFLSDFEQRSSKESKLKTVIKKEYVENNFADILLDIGRSIDIFTFHSKENVEVIWEHEIYRDYLVARGYALYSAYNKNSEGCIYNLARQVNFRFPEEDDMKPKVDDITREYHSRKAQMFIDMVDTSLDSDSDVNTDFLKEMKKSAVYRRLTRDVAFNYRTHGLSKMAAAAELSLQYYLVDDNIISDSIYDYRDPDRRKADVAYSLSGLGYACVNKNVPADKKEYYHEIATKALDRSESIFNELRDTGSKAWDLITVRNDSLKCQGNKAAYIFSTAQKVKNKDKNEYQRLILNARTNHQNNLTERIKLRDAIIKSNRNPHRIDNDIAQSMTGIATSYFHLGQYEDALKFNRAAIAFRPKDNYQDIFYNNRNIVGCYIGMKKRDFETVVVALDSMKAMLEYANQHNIYEAFPEVKKINKYLDDLTSIDYETKEQDVINEKIKDIKEEISELNKKSINQLEK